MFKRYWFLLIVVAALMQVGCGDEGDKKKKGPAASGPFGGEGFAAKPEKGPTQYTAAPLVPPDTPAAGQQQPQGAGNPAAAPANNPDATNAQPANDGGQAAAGNPAARAAKAPPAKGITVGGQRLVLRSEVAGQELDPAKAGVGVKGQGYGGGIVTEPVRQYFLGQDRINLEIQYPKAIKEYRAFNNNKNPPTLEAFYNDILVPYGIALPELREGEFYVYDPKGKEAEDMLLVAKQQQ
jgi:hypothetical protein